MEKENKKKAKPEIFTSVIVALGKNQRIFEEQEKENHDHLVSFHHAEVITESVNPWPRPSNPEFPETSISSSLNKAPA